MYAIVETGGKQYRVTKGDLIQVEKLEKEKGKITLDKVLLIENDKETLVGAPYIEGAAVEAKVLDHGKGKKIIIYKYKAKKDYRRKQGHRQPYTEIEITGVTTGGAKRTAPKAEVKVSTDKKAEDTQAKKKKPALSGMKKAELIEFAKENNIEIDEKATKPVIIEAINKEFE